MKKSKILLPILTVAGSAAALTPAIMLTSCGEDPVNEIKMILSSSMSTNVWAGANNGRISLTKNTTYKINLPQSAGSFGYINVQIINVTEGTFCHLDTSATINGKAVKFTADGAGGYQYKIEYKERFTQDLTIVFTSKDDFTGANISAKFVAA